MRAARIKTKSVLDFPASELADVVAVKALWTGEATEDQQKRAINWIVQNLCLIGDIGFSLVEGPRASDFADGKKFVANILIWCAKTSIKEMRDRYPDQMRHKAIGESNDRPDA